MYFASHWLFELSLEVTKAQVQLSEPPDCDLEEAGYSIANQDSYKTASGNETVVKQFYSTFCGQ